MFRCSSSVIVPFRDLFTIPFPSSRFASACSSSGVDTLRTSSANNAMSLSSSSMKADKEKGMSVSGSGNVGTVPEGT